MENQRKEDFVKIDPKLMRTSRITCSKCKWTSTKRACSKFYLSRICPVCHGAVKLIKRATEPFVPLILDPKYSDSIDVGDNSHSKKSRVSEISGIMNMIEIISCGDAIAINEGPIAISEVSTAIREDAIAISEDVIATGKEENIKKASEPNELRTIKKASRLGAIQEAIDDDVIQVIDLTSESESESDEPELNKSTNA